MDKELVQQFRDEIDEIRLYAVKVAEFLERDASRMPSGSTANIRFAGKAYAYHEMAGKLLDVLDRHPVG